jgi:hypothetical protein
LKSRERSARRRLIKGEMKGFYDNSGVKSTKENDERGTMNAE